MGRTLLKVTDLHAGYGRAEVLTGLNFEVQAGQVVTIIGPNGAGKSTTLNALMAVLPSRGSIVFDGVNLNELTLEGAGRVSDYDSGAGTTGTVWTYNLGAIYSPVDGVRFRGGYAKSVRAPTLFNLYRPPSQTFLNGLIDPCSQTNINNGTANRVANCAAGGVARLMDGSISDSSISASPQRSAATPGPCDSPAPESAPARWRLAPRVRHRAADSSLPAEPALQPAPSQVFPAAKAVKLRTPLQGFAAFPFPPPDSILPWYTGRRSA